ncbi:stilbene synthase [Rubrobacter marinus]|uniref:Stilbene synthase n=1 Tax=Rubrobacter marinus TaxID=2653852 RepID=A0A6G8PYE9_9ACTN|nr:3-oxoacyl-[acyl-carrier-protein] synthase III C-terminal domain-containing protein [Rubrobacter marinus]QIN79249.1 stilbene synthase [Rubrobacter marinus]
MRDVNPRVLSVATSVPRHRISQETAKDLARAMFSEVYRDIERLLPVFDHVEIEGRNFCVPPEWFYEDHTFPEKNALYVENALDLSEKAARRALDRAGVEPAEVGAVFFVSTTGLSTPSIDSQLLPRLGLSEETRRVPIWGLGCAAGASGLSVAADHVRLYPEKPILFVAVELCGLTFQKGDRSKAGLISTALFADGAAALVLGGPERGGSGPELLGSHSTTWTGTEDIMGWELVESGFKVRLSRSVPDLVRNRMPENLEKALGSVGLAFEELEHFVTHPGGAKVLDAFEEVFGLEPGGLALSREVLRYHGNMSSVTVLFILERLLESGDASPGDLGVLSAMGPGFSAEHVFFRC